MDAPLLARERKNRIWPARLFAVERLDRLLAWVVLTELFLGLGWLRAVAEKLIDPAWWRGEVIEYFVADHADTALGWYRPFLEAVVLPLAPVIAAIVVVGQLLAGVSLVTGRGRPVHRTSVPIDRAR